MHVLWKHILSLLAVALVVTTAPATADIVIPGADGPNGAFAPAADIEIDLSLAPTGSWDSAGGVNGVYDPDKWAVVFKFSEVNIPAGVTVTFKNHPSRAPVVWLVSGDANIAGTLSLSGQDVQVAPVYAEPGPGGFTGGIGYQNLSGVSGGGQGVGGGLQGGSAGTHATAGQNNPSLPYGNHRALPLVGGSGGGGGYQNNIRGGGAGGGALLLAVQGALTVNGIIRANGGAGYYSGAGAGGAIRVIADTVAGSGQILALGGNDGSGGEGRVRIEAVNAVAAWSVLPVANVVTPDDPVLLWLPDGAPTAQVVSIGGAAVPVDPHARLELAQEDMVLPLISGDADIEVQTTNVDTVAATVQVRITPEHGAPFFVDAVFESGTLAQATWLATATLPVGRFTVQAHAINPAL